jgi:protein-S-isoprenylcysteine O-methyltransferase Ste14
MMPMDIHIVGAIIRGLWIIFTVYWFVNAFGNKKNVYKQKAGSRLTYLGFLIIVVSVLFQSKLLQISILPYNLVTQVVGIVLCAGGIGLAIWARKILGGNWSGVVTLKENHELIQSGPYRFVRHPIYTGIIIAVIGSFVAVVLTIQTLFVCLLFGVMLRIKSLGEEKIMMGQFPEKYPEYKRNVKALIPFVY